MKGLFIFYIQIPETDAEKTSEEVIVIQQRTIAVIKGQNQELIQRMVNEGYEVMYIPVVGESSRVDRIDFDRGL